MSQRLELVNGLPVMKDLSEDAYDESQIFNSGLSSGSTITIPNGKTFNNSDASDVIITFNQKVVEVTRDLVVLGLGPTYTQIQTVYDLPDNCVVRFKKTV